MVALEPHGPSSHRSTHTTAYDMVAWSILSYSCISCVLAFSQLAIVLKGTVCTTGSWPANVTISTAPLIASILLLRDFFRPGFRPRPRQNSRRAVCICLNTGNRIYLDLTKLQRSPRAGGPF